MTYETIRYGSNGKTVKKLQTALKERGHDLTIDGRFGPQTRQAVVQYQRRNGLRSDGVVGPRTWDVLTDSGNTEVTPMKDSGARQAARSTIPASAAADGGAVLTTASSGNEAKPTLQNSSGYTPSPEVIDAEQKLEEIEDSRPGAYDSPYADALEALYDQILGRPDFSYDLARDPMYQQYRQQYLSQGRLAMEDTMGMAAGLTGGYGSSYSQNVGQQAYGHYLQGLNDMVPQLYSLALDQYTAQGQALADRYAMTHELERRDRERYDEAYDRWFQEYNQAWRNLESVREEDYDRYLDLLEAAERAARANASSGSGGKTDSPSSGGGGKTGSSSSGGGGKAGSSSSGGGKKAAMDDFDLRELAWMYMDGGGNADYRSASMRQWMREQGISQEQEEQFYEELRKLGYQPSRSSGGGNQNPGSRDVRLN